MRTDKNKLLETLDRFGEVTVAVAGDLLADLYITARPVGLSREAPVMVLKEEDRWVSPGGAANAVNNVLALSGKARCLGLLGDDEPGEKLLAALESAGVDGGRIVKVAGAKTCSKTRVFAGDVHTVKQQVLRLDREPADRMTARIEADLIKAIGETAKTADAWLVSDYDGDFFSPGVVSAINSLAKERVVVVDSHRRLTSFVGAACATPNEGEAEAASGVKISDEESAAEAAQRLRGAMEADWVFLTRGNAGLLIAGRKGPVLRVPIAGPADIVDVAGAGDTVAAVVTLSLALGADAETAGVLSAYAASVVCMKTGVATATPDEVRAAIDEYPVPPVS